MYTHVLIDELPISIIAGVIMVSTEPKQLQIMELFTAFKKPTN